MSVQTEIDRIITAVQAAHEKVVEKGGTTTQPYLVGNLASAIDTIPDATEPVLQTKTVTPTTAKQTIKPDSGYDGLSQVDVNAIPSSYIQPSGTLEVTENGTHDVTNYASVNVNVPSSGGGGSIGTCTLIVEASPINLQKLCYQETLGEAVVILADPVTPVAGTYTAVCGTMVSMGLRSGVTITCENAELMAGRVGNIAIITAKAGEIARITIT